MVCRATSADAGLTGVVDGKRYDPPEFPGTPPQDIDNLVALWELRV